MKQTGKRIVILLVGILLVAGCVILYHFSQESLLGREKDKEFNSGTKIRLEQVNQEQEEALYKLCKVWGYVKYRHPSVIDGTLNWDAELFRIMPEVLAAKGQEEVNQALYQWLNQFAYEVNETEELQEWLEIQETYGEETLNLDWIKDQAYLGANLSGYLEGLSQVFVAERNVGYASFEENSPYVSLEYERGYPFSPEDAGIKLLSLFRFWNVYEYYSPNLELTKQDWDEVLREAISEVCMADSYKNYVLAIAKVTAKTGDAHISLHDRENTLAFLYGTYYLPCDIKNVEGQIVVSQTSNTGEGLQNGDIITEIDGMSVQDRIQELSQYIPIPTSDKIIYKLRTALRATSQQNATVKVIRDGKELSLQTICNKTEFQWKNPYENGLLEGNQVGYIDPSALKEGELQKLMEEFSDTKGIIVDLRQYPSVVITHLLAEYIIPEPKEFAKVTFPNQAIPGCFWSHHNQSSGAGSLKEAGGTEDYPFYEGKVILLIDETSVSQSEYAVMSLRQAPNASVVGSPSLGADGNVVRLELPGRLLLAYTGLGVYTPEGEQTQRVGIQPDIICLPTVEGLKEGRDELIEKAIELIQ